MPWGLPRILVKERTKMFERVRAMEIFGDRGSWRKAICDLEKERIKIRESESDGE